MDVLFDLLREYWLLVIVLAVGVIFYVGRDETKVGLTGIANLDDDDDADENW